MPGQASPRTRLGELFTPLPSDRLDGGETGCLATLPFQESHPTLGRVSLEWTSLSVHAHAFLFVAFAARDYRGTPGSI